MSNDRPAPEGVDPTKPNAARIYNYLLGGKDNYEADRMVAQRMLSIAPDNRTLATLSRAFLTGSAKMAAETGIRQFVDIGSGIPASPSVYETVMAVDPDSRLASIDYDPVVIAHTNAMFCDLPGVTPMLGDFREPDDIIARLPEAGIDLSEPIALLLVGLLHFVLEDEKPAEVMARLHEVMAPGSYVAFTHGATESDKTWVQQTVTDTVGSTAQFVFRSRADVATIFKGFDLLDPGIVPVQQWLSDDLPDTRMVVLGGICRKS
ncbi:SAM-dependent methyltransferase [Nocardia sp. NEAU-G5]|uniref:SAM-dependent methyltransferase n=1 Tax=Nocardia albiluteola TaxID=2842303 RepID=A0ABS6AY93_9NOCA|nr:SAM-dependent methyltransferase [Nocardia albiluteola]MBU3063017.1 SAM-dependent methyltransferase [Nocardia albiluteola]